VDNSPEKEAQMMREYALVFIQMAEDLKARDPNDTSIDLRSYCLKLLHYIAELQWSAANLIELKPVVLLVGLAQDGLFPPEASSGMPAYLEKPPFEEDFFNGN
jgi:hypothetical protein